MNETIAQLRQRAYRIRRNVLRMARGKGDGYVGQGLGAADILAAVYFGEMRFDPARLDWPDRDRFVLSTGHYSIVLFAALAELGVFREEELATYGADQSRLEMSTCITTPGVEITGGSLGHGLSQSVGMALGARLSGRDFRVFNFLSDGELQEGVTWEAAMAAAHYHLGNLIALVDVNNMQADGEVAGVMTIEPVADKWRAFGWHTLEINGHDPNAVRSAFEEAAATKGKPTAIVAHTVKGKGVSFMENNPKFHGVAPTQDELKLALQELN